MNPPVMQPQYRTVSAVGMASAFVVIGRWLLEHWHIQIPDNVTEAATFLITSGLAWFVHSKPSEAISAPPPPAQ